MKSNRWIDRQQAEKKEKIDMKTDREAGRMRESERETPINM